jgi:hypothetical protein
VEVGVVGPHRVDDVGGGQVMGAAGQHGVDHGAPRCRHPAAVTAQPVENVVERVIHTRVVHEYSVRQLSRTVPCCQ